MLGLGFGEILVIAVVLLVVVGPERLPEFMRTAGKMYGQVRRASDDLRRTFVVEADRMDAEERYKKLQERRKAAEDARKAAAEATGGVAQTAPLPTPAATAAPVPVSPVDDDPERPATPFELPPGVSAEEWMALPPAVRTLLRAQTATKGPEVSG